MCRCILIWRLSQTHKNFRYSYTRCAFVSIFRTVNQIHCDAHSLYQFQFITNSNSIVQKINYSLYWQIVGRTEAGCIYATASQFPAQFNFMDYWLCTNMAPMIIINDNILSPICHEIPSKPTHFLGEWTILLPSVVCYVYSVYTEMLCVKKWIYSEEWWIFAYVREHLICCCCCCCLHTISFQWRSWFRCIIIIGTESAWFRVFRFWNAFIRNLCCTKQIPNTCSVVGLSTMSLPFSYVWCNIINNSGSIGVTIRIRATDVGSVTFMMNTTAHD